MPNDPSSVASIRGLSEADVQVRLKTEGYNELPSAERIVADDDGRHNPVTADATA